MMSVNEFTVVKNTTKKANNLIHNYRDAIRKYGCRTLSECYNHYSDFKAQAFEDICEECHENNGYSMTIPRYSITSFSVAYLMADGENEWLIYHTRDNRYAVQLPEELAGCLG